MLTLSSESCLSRLASKGIRQRVYFRSLHLLNKSCCALKMLHSDSLLEPYLYLEVISFCEMSKMIFRGGTYHFPFTSRDVLTFVRARPCVLHTNRI